MLYSLPSQYYTADILLIIIYYVIIITFGLWSVFKQGVLSAFMSFEVSLLSCLIFTLVTRIFYTFVHRLLVNLKTALCCCLVFTLVARIFYTLRQTDMADTLYG